MKNIYKIITVLTVLVLATMVPNTAYAAVFNREKSQEEEIFGTILVTAVWILLIVGVIFFIYQWLRIKFDLDNRQDGIFKIINKRKIESAKKADYILFKNVKEIKDNEVDTDSFNDEFYNWLNEDSSYIIDLYKQTANTIKKDFQDKSVYANNFVKEVFSSSIYKLKLSSTSNNKVDEKTSKTLIQQLPKLLYNHINKCLNDNKLNIFLNDYNKTYYINTLNNLKNHFKGYKF